MPVTTRSSRRGELGPTDTSGATQYSAPASAPPTTSQAPQAGPKMHKATVVSSSSPSTTARADRVDMTQDSPPKKRKSNKTTKSDADDTKPKKKAKKAKDEETRLRKWRSHAPLSYLEIHDRALTQRMFALDRKRSNDNPDHPTETVTLAGTTGNVYTIVIDKVPSCDCPHARKGNQCKHIVYVLSRILRAPPDLEYQLAFMSSELRDIFAEAPPLPSETMEKGGQDGNRKPLEGECPICVCDFEPESGEAVVYCKAACGNNIHKSCFNQWAATKRNGTVTCPFCRTPWQSDEGVAKDVAKDVARTGPVNEEGYVNVAQQLGLSGRRDYSTYHRPWLAKRAYRA